MSTPALKSESRAVRIRRPSDLPTLTFSPLAWLKLKYLCHAGDTEIGGFGLSSESDPFYIEDILVPRQDTTAVHVSFHPDSVADITEDLVERGVEPNRCRRVWIHTHPGTSPNPSSTDERTFQDVFGRCDWSVMFILARGGDTYARLQFNAGPGASLNVPVAVDWDRWPHQAPGVAAAVAAWEELYRSRVFPEWGGLGDFRREDDPLDRDDPFRPYQSFGRMTDEEWLKFNLEVDRG